MLPFHLLLYNSASEKSTVVGVLKKGFDPQIILSDYKYKLVKTLKRIHTWNG